MDDEYGKEYRPHDIGLGGYLDIDIVNKVNMQLYSPEERFHIALDKSFRTINERYYVDPQDQRSMKELVTKLPHYTFKNATTFVLGCLATHNHEGQIFSKKTLNEVFELLPIFKESENIEKVDVLRYARFALKEDFKFVD
jgi:hypothetical protein